MEDNFEFIKKVLLITLLVGGIALLLKGSHSYYQKHYSTDKTTEETEPIKVFDTESEEAKDWTNIHTDFRSELDNLKKKWIDCEITYEACKDWIEIGAEPRQYAIIKNLIDQKADWSKAKWVLDNWQGTIEELWEAKKPQEREEHPDNSNNSGNELKFSENDKEKIKEISSNWIPFKKGDKLTLNHVKCLIKISNLYYKILIENNKSNQNQENFYKKHSIILIEKDFNEILQDSFWEKEQELIIILKPIYHNNLVVDWNCYFCERTLETIHCLETNSDSDKLLKFFKDNSKELYRQSQLERNELKFSDSILNRNFNLEGLSSSLKILKSIGLIKSYFLSVGNINNDCLDEIKDSGETIELVIESYNKLFVNG